MLAIAVTVPYLMGIADIEPLDLNFLFLQEPWRVVTSALPHLSPLHLIFNIFMLWRFGTVLEERWGSLRLLGVFVLIDAGSMAAEHAVLDGGFGLSGIVYGLFGVLLASSRLDPRRPEDMDVGTTQMMIGWGVICVVTTLMGIMAVANIAHGMGLLLGLLVGAAASAPDRAKRMRSAFGAALITAACVTAAHPDVRPHLNWSSIAGNDEAFHGWIALEEKRNEEGLALYLRSIELGRPVASRYYNLGIALQRSGDLAAAGKSFQRAYELEPHDPKYRNAAEAYSASHLLLIDTSGNPASANPTSANPSPSP